MLQVVLKKISEMFGDPTTKFQSGGMWERGSGRAGERESGGSVGILESDVVYFQRNKNL